MSATLTTRRPSTDSISPPKDQVNHTEDTKEEEANVRLKSSFDQLSILKTLSLFRRSVVICTLAGFTAACDGGS